MRKAGDSDGATRQVDNQKEGARHGQVMLTAERATRQAGDAGSGGGENSGSRPKGMGNKAGT